MDKEGNEAEGPHTSPFSFPPSLPFSSSLLGLKVSLLFSGIVVESQGLPLVIVITHSHHKLQE